MSRRYALRNDQWNRIEPLLSARKGHPGRTARNNRLLAETALYRYRTGIVWLNLPERSGYYRVVRLRRTRWSKNGAWRHVFKVLAQDADNEYAMIAPTLARASAQRQGYAD